MDEPGPNQLNYAPPKELPWWGHLAAAVFWIVVYTLVYSMAVAGPLFLVLSVFVLSHPEGEKAFGEPIQTTWQKVRLVGWPAVLSAVFILLAIWLRRYGRR